jgi:hypothetical protein
MFKGNTEGRSGGRKKAFKRVRRARRRAHVFTYRDRYSLRRRSHCNFADYKRATVSVRRYFVSFDKVPLVRLLQLCATQQTKSIIGK